MQKFYDVFGRLRVLKIPYNSIAATCMLLVVLAGFCSVKAHAQGKGKITIIGTVTDTLGVTIIGANIGPLSGKGNSTATDVNGKFLLDVEPGAVLKITYIGYVEQHITVAADQKPV